jgi:preprotein translocase subunit SecG
MEVLLIVIHVLVALFMILVVLVQGGSQGGVGAAFGGGNTQGVFGSTGATSFLGKLTYGAAAIFMGTSILLVIMQGGHKLGLSKKLEEQNKHEQLDPAAQPQDVKPAPTDTDGATTK